MLCSIRKMRDSLGRYGFYVVNKINNKQVAEYWFSTLEERFIVIRTLRSLKTFP